MGSAVKKDTQLMPTANGQPQRQLERFKPGSEPIRSIGDEMARRVAPFKRRVQLEISRLANQGKEGAAGKVSQLAPRMTEEIGQLLAGGKNFEEATLMALATVYKNERVIIYPHRNPDADAISSAAALKERFPNAVESIGFH